jgi:hypothetical protein
MRCARIALAMGMLVALTGCAPLSEDECLAGDWRGIGFSDGAKGRAPDFIDRHRDACAKVGVTPDVTAWLAGRKEGLARYCTPASAYAQGRAGRNIAPYCSSDELAVMRPAHDRGRIYFEIGQDIAAERRNLWEIDRLIRDLPGDAAGDRSWLFFERSRIQRRILTLENRQWRYAGWPG